MLSNIVPGEEEPTVSSGSSTGGVKRRYSLEVTAKDTDSFIRSAARFSPQTKVSVAHVASEDDDARIRSASAISAMGFSPVPHISARRLRSASDLDRVLSSLTEQAAVQQVFVIAGDPATPAGPFEDSASVIRSGILAKHGIRKVGIAGYPQGHHKIADKTLWCSLRDKLRILAESGHESEITTQFTFDAQPVLDWLADLRDQGFTAPVRVGIPGPASVKTLLQFAARCGVSASGNILAKYGLSLSRLLATAGPDGLIANFCDRLEAARHGEVHFHFYPFGGLGKTADWLQENPQFQVTR